MALGEEGVGHRAHRGARQRRAACEDFSQSPIPNPQSPLCAPLPRTPCALPPTIPQSRHFSPLPPKPPPNHADPTTKTQARAGINTNKPIKGITIMFNTPFAPSFGFNNFQPFSGGFPTNWNQNWNPNFNPNFNNAWGQSNWNNQTPFSGFGFNNNFNNFQGFQGGWNNWNPQFSGWNNANNWNGFNNNWNNNFQGGWNNNTPFNAWNNNAGWNNSWNNGWNDNSDWNNEGNFESNAPFNGFAPFPGAFNPSFNGGFNPAFNNGFNPAFNSGFNPNFAATQAA